MKEIHTQKNESTDKVNSTDIHQINIHIVNISVYGYKVNIIYKRTKTFLEKNHICI